MLWIWRQIQDDKSVFSLARHIISGGHEQQFTKMLVYYFIFGTSSLFLLLSYYLQKRRKYWTIRGISGPKPHFFFGNIKNAVLRKENMAETLQKIYNEFPNEPIVGMYRMTTPCILIRDLDVIKNIMIKDFDKFQDRGIEFSKEGLGANLFHADGETWQVLRNRFSPLFTTGKLKNMVYLINQKSDTILNHIDELVNDKSEHEIMMAMRSYTTTTIASCAFGLDFDTMDEFLVKSLSRIDSLTFNCNFFHETDMMFPGLLKKFGGSLFPSDVLNFFYNMVTKVITERNGVPSNRHDFMDLILEIREQGDITLRKNDKGQENLKLTLTESVIAAQAFVFYAAGYETSASVLTYLIYELAKNPVIQEKFIEEIDSKLKEHKGEITYETVFNNKYMEMVFNEVYRKYPIVPILRRSNADYDIPGTKYTIEKDTVVLIPTLGIHYDEKYYPEPKKFDPGRFSSDNTKNRHSCAYLPYGVGPRNCIGKHLIFLFLFKKLNPF